MSLFQCSKCGVCENTACSNGSRSYFNNHRGDDAKSIAALASYKAVLGLREDEDFGAYCSACSPFWFTLYGDFGVGANPHPVPGVGLWHGRFPQKFYPLGTMETNSEGNLSPIRSTVLSRAATDGGKR